MLLMALMMMADKPWQGGEIKERLAAPITASFDTAKRADQLEICLADVLSVIGLPAVFRDGPDNIVVLTTTGVGGPYMASINVNKTATGSHLDLRIRGKGWDDRMKERINVCLA